MFRLLCSITIALVALLPAGAAAQSPRAVTLGTPEAEQAVDLHVSGFGLEYVSLKMTSKSLDSLGVVVPVGLVFKPKNPSVQTMVVTQEQRVVLSRTGTSRELKIRVACTQMAKDAPGEDDVLQISRNPASSELARLVAVSEFRSQPFRVQQFAVWTVTDNPSRKGYTGIGMYVGEGPSPAELEAVRTLLVAAGLDPKKFRAFR